MTPLTTIVLWIGWAAIAAGALIIVVVTVGAIYDWRRRRHVDLAARLGPLPASHQLVRPVRDERGRR